MVRCDAAQATSPMTFPSSGVGHSRVHVPALGVDSTWDGSIPSALVWDEDSLVASPEARWWVPVY